MQIDYSKRIFGLDLMRAVAILMVVFSHIRWITPNAHGVIPDIMSISGVMGVEIFFCLSGFLIGRILYRTYLSPEFNFKSVFYFWIRRWFRTLPNYYLVLILNILIVLYIGNELPEHLWRYFLFLHNFVTEMPLFFAESWSLSIEEFAYLLGPFLLYMTLFWKSETPKPKLFLLITLTIIVAFLVSKLIYNSSETIRDMRHWNVNVKGMVIYRIDAIYFGVLGAYLSIVYPNFWKRIRFVIFPIGLFSLLGLIFLIPMNGIFINSYPAFWNVWYFEIKSLALLCTLPLLSYWRSNTSWFLKPVTYISIISYAIYLLHYSIIMQLMKYFIPSEPLAGFDIAVYIFVYVLITLVSSYFLYRFYEKPLTDLRDSKWIKSSLN